MENILPILIADAPRALIELCGVNLLERLLRILQRLGFRRAIVFSTTPEIVGAELAKRSWPREHIRKIDHGKIDAVDAAKQDDYIVAMRRHVRPLCFRVPLEQDRRLAERIILDSAQKGTLDLPAYLHAPTETALISLLCKTRITP